MQIGVGHDRNRDQLFVIKQRREEWPHRMLIQIEGLQRDVPGVLLKIPFARQIDQAAGFGSFAQSAVGPADL